MCDDLYQGFSNVVNNILYRYRYMYRYIRQTKVELDMGSDPHRLALLMSPRGSLRHSLQTAAPGLSPHFAKEGARAQEGKVYSPVVLLVRSRKGSGFRYFDLFH